MKNEFSGKSSIDDIRQRFDNDVDRFSNLETGQTATVDAPLAMALITQAACAVNSQIHHVLDIGCGAGNNTLKLLESAKDANCDLLDLSKPMLERAQQRVQAATRGKVRTFHGDIRDVELPTQQYDTVLAAAVLHHLRDENDWLSAFSKIYQLVAKGGSFWITDLVFHENTHVQQLMWARYSEYLVSAGGPAYRDKVFEYIEIEDSPRSVTFQMDMLKQAGFSQIEILHKNSCFAAFGAIKE